MLLRILFCEIKSIHGGRSFRKKMYGHNAFHAGTPAVSF